MPRLTRIGSTARAIDLRMTADELTVLLTDGRRISAPLVWFPRLLNATKEQRDNWGSWEMEKESIGLQSTRI